MARSLILPFTVVFQWLFLRHGCSRMVLACCAWVCLGFLAGLFGDKASAGFSADSDVDGDDSNDDSLFNSDDAGADGDHDGVTALGLSPGRVATERVRDAGLATEAFETPAYAGRAVAALLADPAVARHAGQVLSVADLAHAHGFTDRDGSRPERFVPQA